MVRLYNQPVYSAIHGSVFGTIRCASVRLQKLHGLQHGVSVVAINRKAEFFSLAGTLVRAMIMVVIMIVIVFSSKGDRQEGQGESNKLHGKIAF